MAQRAQEIRRAGAKIDAMLSLGRANAVVGRNGAITFTGIPDDVRDGLTDACVYRRIMASGSHAAKQAIVKAERAAGRAVDKSVVASGIHSHDGGKSWHPRG